MSHPDDSPERVHEEIEEAVRRAAAEDPWMREHPPTVEWLHHWPRSAIAADHPIVAATAGPTNAPLACLRVWPASRPSTTRPG